MPRPMRLTANTLAVWGQKQGLVTGAERAAALGISRSHLLHVERGAVYPSPQLVDRMAAVYKRTSDEVERAAHLARETLAHRMLAQARQLG